MSEMNGAEAVIEVLRTWPVCATFEVTAENKFAINPNSILRSPEGPAIREALRRNRPEVLEIVAEARTADLHALYTTLRATATDLLEMEVGDRAASPYEEKLGHYKRTLAMYQIACCMATSSEDRGSQMRLEIGA